MININIAVVERVASAPPNAYIVCGNTDYQITFEFDADWDENAAKMARFEFNGEFINRAFAGNTVSVPKLENTDHVEVGVFCEDMATTPARIRCKRSIISEATEAEEPEDNVFSEFLESADAILVSAESARENAEQARASAEAARVASESGRVDAESARAAAESARANAAASAVNAANAAAERAEEAADACESAVAEIPAQMDAAVGRIIDDTVVSASNPWSSQRIVNALCPPMEVSGNPVTCYPVAGSPLNVSARIEPVQHLDWMKREGLTTQDGTPSPDAPVPLVDSVPAGSYYVPSTAPDGGYWRVDLAEALGGVSGYNDALEIDAYTGRYRVVRNTALSVLVGTETVNKYNTSSGTLFRISGDYGLEADSVRMACTHYVVTSGMNRRDKTLSVSARLVNVDIIDNDFNDTPSFLNYIAAQHAAGTPVTIRYALAAPIITTGQATHVTSTTGLTALAAMSMGLTAPDPEHPCEITVADAVQITHNGDTYNVALPEGFAGGEVDVAGIIALPGCNTLTSDAQGLTVRGYADPKRMLSTLVDVLTSGNFEGVKGDKGDTPVKGVDYWTQADMEQMVQDVLTALPDASEGVY